MIFVSELFKNIKFKDFKHNEFCYLCTTSVKEFKEIKQLLNGFQINDNLLILSKYKRRKAIALGAKESLNIVNLKLRKINYANYKVYKKRKIFFLLPWI